MLIKIIEFLEGGDYFNFIKSVPAEFKNHFKNNDDKAKLDMLVSEHITINDIKVELEKNQDYFCRKIEFEGGFVLEPIFKNKSIEFNNLPESITKSIQENIINIRNSLVHLRESRENKVILPTKQNDNQIIPYLYVLRRIAEKIIINT